MRAVGGRVARLARRKAAGDLQFGYGTAVRGDGGVIAVGAYIENNDEGSVYVYRDVRLRGGGAGAVLGSDARLGTVEVVGQGSGVGERANADDARLYRIVGWSAYGGTAAWFGFAVVYLEAAGWRCCWLGRRSTRLVVAWRAGVGAAQGVERCMC